MFPGLMSRCTTWCWWHHSTAAALAYIATWQAGMFHPADMVESFTAKAEDRDPEFEDLGPFRGGVGGGV